MLTKADQIFSSPKFWGFFIFGVREEGCLIYIDYVTAVAMTISLFVVLAPFGSKFDALTDIFLNTSVIFLILI